MSNLQLNVSTDAININDLSRVINGADLSRAAKRRTLEQKQEQIWLAAALEDVLSCDLDESILEAYIEGDA